MNLIRYSRHECPVLSAYVVKWRAFFSFLKVVFVFPFDIVILYNNVTVAKVVTVTELIFTNTLYNRGTKMSTITSSHPLTLCMVLDFPTCTDLLTG